MTHARYLQVALAALLLVPMVADASPRWRDRREDRRDRREDRRDRRWP